MKCTTARHIKQLMARETGIPPIDLVSARRMRHIVEARHVAMWLMRRYTTLSLPQIAQALGRSDHSTGLYGVRRVEQALAEANRGRHSALATLAWHCEAVLLAELERQEAMDAGHHRRAALRRDIERRMPAGWGWREYLAEQMRRNRQRRVMLLRMQMEARRPRRLPAADLRRIRPLRFASVRSRTRGAAAERRHHTPAMPVERFDREAFYASLRIFQPRQEERT